jgi:hypothetical protein
MCQSSYLFGIKREELFHLNRKQENVVVNRSETLLSNGLAGATYCLFENQDSTISNTDGLKRTI